MDAEAVGFRHGEVNRKGILGFILGTKQVSWVKSCDCLDQFIDHNVEHAQGFSYVDAGTFFSLASLADSSRFMLYSCVQNIWWQLSQRTQSRVVCL